MKIKNLAIANRGEVAVRIIRAAKELGVRTSLLASEADLKSRAAREADTVVCIGTSPSAESYLNIPRVIDGIQAAGADAVHPGFGFLSENADFVAQLEKQKITFVGPPAQAMALLGDKVSCKKIAEQRGIPMIPGYQGEEQSLSRLTSEVQKIGLPVIVKAAAGGGGRGMKLINHPSDIESQIESAKRESLAAFGSERVFLERYLNRAKHIEVQVFVASCGRVMHLHERECSIQRRHQKIIEEANSAKIDVALLQKLFKASTDLVEHTGYQGAATVEFLVQDQEFFLLEVNTRLQVEHPVTEMVMGVDLVKAQLLTACGYDLPVHFTKNEGFGHAIECRLLAENPFQGGVPSTGKILYQHFPEGPGRRFEYAFEAGDEITPFYDSMFAKVIVWDETRTRAIQKMIQTLKETVVFGVDTNIPLLLAILNHPEFQDGSMTTQFMETHFPNGLAAAGQTDNQQQRLARELRRFAGQSIPKEQPMGAGLTAQHNPFTQFWRNS